jgi:hypothetical protein
LLVAFIPALLMLATFGLSRLEENLVDDAVSPADVVAALEKARADCARPAAPRDDVDEYDPDSAYEPYDPFAGHYGDPVLAEAPSRLPARIYVHHRTNPEFQPTRQADRV